MIFVFGSNLAGVHGAGAAAFAKRHHGAVQGIGVGMSGNSYAIPTKDQEIKTLPIPTIAYYVTKFLNHAKAHPKLTYNVTRIGCGLAGYKDEDIAPLFKGAPANCVLPPMWRDIADRPQS